MAVPVAVTGTLLLVGGAGRGGSDAAAGVMFGLGSCCCFSGYMVCQRMNRDGGHLVGPLLDATIGGAIAATVLGLATRSLSIPPPAAAQPYLITLALWSQTIGWLFITYALRCMPAARGTLLLLINPVVAVAVSAFALGQRPSALQLAGWLMVCAAVTLGSGRRRRDTVPSAPSAG